MAKPKLCNNTNCKKGPGKTRKKMSKDSESGWCCDNCHHATRNRVYYNRRKEGIRLKKCPTCGGTGHVES